MTSAVLNSELASNLPQQLPAEQAALVLASSEYVHNGLPVEYLDTTLNIYVDSLRLCWHVLIPMAGLGFFSSLIVKHHSIRRPPPAGQIKSESVAVEVPPQSEPESPTVNMTHTSDIKHEEKTEA
jgi:hypothetical protein